MILTSDVDLRHPPASAPDAVLHAIADELRRRGCAIGRMMPGIVEFRGPSVFRFTFSYTEQAAAMVSRGVLRVDPAAGRARLTLHVSPLQFLVVAMVGVAAMAMDSPASFRLFFLAAAAAMLWVNLTTARWAYKRWVADGVRRS